MAKQTKKITLESLANKVDKLASTMDAGFKQLGSRIDKGFKEAKEDNESLTRMVANGFEQTAESIAKLKQGQENIQLRVDNLAPQFEVRELTRRVKRLEVRAVEVHGGL